MDTYYNLFFFNPYYDLPACMHAIMTKYSFFILQLVVIVLIVIVEVVVVEIHNIT